MEYIVRLEHGPPSSQLDFFSHDWPFGTVAKGHKKAAVAYVLGKAYDIQSPFEPSHCENTP
jgi:hypothetical protein